MGQSSFEKYDVQMEKTDEGFGMYFAKDAQDRLLIDGFRQPLPEGFTDIRISDQLTHIDKLDVRKLQVLEVIEMLRNADIGKHTLSFCKVEHVHDQQWQHEWEDFSLANDLRALTMDSFLQNFQMICTKEQHESLMQDFPALYEYFKHRSSQLLRESEWPIPSICATKTFYSSSSCVNIPLIEPDKGLRYVIMNTAKAFHWDPTWAALLFQQLEKLRVYSVEDLAKNLEMRNFGRKMQPSKLPRLTRDILAYMKGLCQQFKSNRRPESPASDISAADTV